MQAYNQVDHKLLNLQLPTCLWSLPQLRVASGGATHRKVRGLIRDSHCTGGEPHTERWPIHVANKAPSTGVNQGVRLLYAPRIA